MPIVSEGGRRGDSGSSGFGRRGQRSGPAAGGGGSFSSSSVVLGSDSRAAVLQCDEMEESDGEVQSSIRGPLDTLDALQEALPKNRKRLPKFYNGKSSSRANAAEPAQDTANPGKPSPKKRKGFLSFSFSWNKSRSKGSSSSRRRDAAATSSKNWRKTLPPSPTTSSSQRNSRGGGNEHARRWLHRRSSTSRGVSASPPSASLRSQLIAVQMQSVCLEDVEESTASLSSREKRRKSLR
ncbi:hypothetical protein SEVIR_4G086200v4 [Setaria viridis]|uniref:Uncharacterized protein n=3 Tax=Setaria TaxID=4554 RepID=K3Y3M4_SETIT|nr:hypothetical protein SETIT_4G087200v2 [Setaria italica]TKW20410.1 hypothetical protein SEVIR_4G086200v2 [Setaria viridis]